MTYYNASGKTRTILENDMCLRRCLEIGVISDSNLARYIYSNSEGKVSSDKEVEKAIRSIIAAIRRYKEEIFEEEKAIKDARKVTSKSSISTRTGLLLLSFDKSQGVGDALADIQKGIRFDRGEVIRVMQTDKAIKIIIKKESLKLVSKCTEKRSVKLKTKPRQLGEINIELSKEARKTPGIITIISSALSRRNINVEEFVTCLPEFLIFIDEKDVALAHTVLSNLSKDT